MKGCLRVAFFYAYIYRMDSISVIITAGGIGKRMNASLPKQFLLIREKPMLMRTIEQFYHFNPKIQIVLTLPEDWKSYWESLQMEYDFTIPHRVVTGGEERYHSIRNALFFCHGDIIAVHDGVRPLVSSGTLERCFEAVVEEEAVIPVLPIKESIRRKEGDHTISVPRSEYLTVQTPQCFKKHVLLKAYEQTYHEGITDDAGLVEEAGFRITTVEGNPENIKITSPVDLRYAELFT